MDQKQSKVLWLMKLATGAALMIYVIYRVYKSAALASPLAIMSFMAGCIAIVIVGYVVVILCQWLADRGHGEAAHGAIRKSIAEVAAIVAVIAIICLIIHMA